MFSTSVDPTTLEGRALLGALAIAADIELHLIRERNERGRSTMQRKNVKAGPKPKVISEAILRALVEKNLSTQEIADEVHVSKATVHRRLKSLGFRTSIKREVDRDPPQN